MAAPFSSPPLPPSPSRAVSRLVIVAAKVPVAGRVKTRLVAAAPDFGPHEAARLAEAFLADTLVLAARPALRADCWLALDGDPADLAAGLVPAGVTIVPQAGNCLGERLVNMTKAGFRAGYGRVCVIGSDAPHLPLAFLEEAFGRLAPAITGSSGDAPPPVADAVFGPADDGGYYLVALRNHAPALFVNISWSGPDVLAETRERANAAGLRLALLPPWYDVDTPVDLDRLRTDLARGVVRAPATERLLVVR